MFDFVETLLFEMPNIEDQLGRFSEAAFKKSHGLVIEIAAIHAGLLLSQGSEFGMKLKTKVKVQEGDILESFEETLKQKTL